MRDGSRNGAEMSSLKTFKLSRAYEISAKKLSMNMNQYVAYLIHLVESNRTRQQEVDSERLAKLEGSFQSMVQSMVNTNISNRARELVQEKQLNALIQVNESLLKRLDAQSTLLQTVFGELTQ
jgi:hypothetical protein